MIATFNLPVSDKPTEPGFDFSRSIAKNFLKNSK